MFVKCMYKNKMCVCVSPPQAAVLHLPAASVPVECVPVGAYATGEMEAKVAHHYW